MNKNRIKRYCAYYTAYCNHDWDTDSCFDVIYDKFKIRHLVCRWYRLVIMWGYLLLNDSKSSKMGTALTFSFIFAVYFFTNSMIAISAIIVAAGIIMELVSVKR